MKRTGLLIFLMIFLLSAYSCDRRKVTRSDTETSGFAYIAGDEGYAPIIKEELDVFTGLNADARIEPVYAGENDIFKMLLDDSIRLIIAARDLTQAEREALIKMRLNPRSQRIGRDGIALIINKSNPDSLINVAALRKIITREISDWREISPSGKSNLGQIGVVFDHPNSSTLRYINELAEGKTLSPELRALGSSTEVIKHVTNTPSALGIIGVNWISNPNDSTKLSFNESIRVMSVGVDDDVNVDTTFKPFPAFLNNGAYPLTRDVFIILTDLRGTLPAGFVKFVGGDAGQRIILKAGLVPGTRPTREIFLKEDF